MPGDGLVAFFIAAAVATQLQGHGTCTESSKVNPVVSLMPHGLDLSWIQSVHSSYLSRRNTGAVAIRVYRPEWYVPPSYQTVISEIALTSYGSGIVNVS